jgi:glycosyltransferase involved in cell wall biosynthesis
VTQVSVIIPTFNRKDRLQKAVSSVLNQTFTDYEIIVVDDGSVDGTLDSLSPFKDSIQLIRHPINRGVSAARNSGIAASRSPFVAFLDSDDHWMPEKLKAQVGFFKKNREAVACQTEEIWIRNGIRVNPKKKHIKPSGVIFEQSLKRCLVSPSAVMLRRSLFDIVGLFDEDFPVCEDYDLWLRICCRYPIHLIKKSLVVKEGGARDQLSASRKGMDRFRIKAMLNLLESGRLSRDQIEMVQREMEIKCRIYGEGCMKRGKRDEGSYYLQLPDEIRQFSRKGSKRNDL